MALKKWNTNFCLEQCNQETPRGGGGGTPLYKPYRYVPPHRVGFLRRFGLKTGVHFAHFGLESGMLFEGTTECMNIFIISIPKQEREMANSKICT